VVPPEQACAERAGEPVPRTLCDAALQQPLLQPRAVHLAVRPPQVPAGRHDKVLDSNQTDDKRSALPGCTRAVPDGCWHGPQATGIAKQH